MLSEADVRDIDESAERAAPNGELLVVVVPSTDGVASRAWATAVFDRLRVDEPLSSAERAEEDVGSADYEVWRCDGCGLVEKSRHAAWLPSHGACSSCGARTWGTESSRTLEAATHVSKGRVEVTEACAHCNHRATSTVVTPKRRTRPGGGSRGASSGDRGGTSSGAGSSGSW